MTRSKGIKVPVLFLFFDTKSASPFVTRRLINKFKRAQWQGPGGFLSPNTFSKFFSEKL